MYRNRLSVLDVNTKTQKQQLCHSRSTWVNYFLLFKHQVVKTTQNTISTKLSKISEVRCLHRVQGILKDNTHTSHGPFPPLPSDKWYSSTYCQTTRLNILSTRKAIEYSHVCISYALCFWEAVDSEEDDRKQEEGGRVWHAAKVPG